MSIQPQIVPTGSLKELSISDIRASDNNPRALFDKEPLRNLKESIQEHGVLVPITVYKAKGATKYSILDGERRYRCCVLLEKEGIVKNIPANIVEPPTKVAALIYMFSIHNFREQWLLMPTALGLKEVIAALDGDNDTKKLAEITGLSTVQVERCKILLDLPKEFQDMSMREEPSERVPANFWIEAQPVVDITAEVLPDLIKELGKKELLRKFVDKYWKGNIKSVTHFRRIQEAAERSKEEGTERKFANDLKRYIEDSGLETRAVFDQYLPRRDIKTVISACEDFVETLGKFNLKFTTEDQEVLVERLKKTRDFLDQTIEKMSGGDPPKESL